MSAQVYLMFGDNNSRSSILDMSRKREEEKHSRQESCGRLLSMLRSRLVLPTCCTRITATENPTSSILEQSNPAISALKSSSIHPKMRWPSAIWLQFLSLLLSTNKPRPSTFRGSSRLPRFAPAISTEL